MDSGKWIRELREERFVKPSDIERVSRSIAEGKGDPDFYVSHSTLADIEAGSVPSIHKLFSLAVCLKTSLDELLLVFGIDREEVTRFAVQPGPGSTQLETTAIRQPDFRFQLNFDRSVNSQETSLLGMEPQELAALPPALQKRLNPKRYRYALIGLNDDTMGDLIPPGALVEVDTAQNAVQISDWRTMRERPVYLVWHTQGHSCCWCQLDGRELILVPFPLSRQPVRRFKVPREASVIGRVVNAWLPFESLPVRSEVY
jgi:transcriptional regulator with XRE-family HTH domain